MKTEHVNEVHVTPTPYGTLRTEISLPNPESGTFDHTLDGFCWCQPLVEEVPPDGRMFIHRRSLDAPHIEAVR